MPHWLQISVKSCVRPIQSIAYPPRRWWEMHRESGFYSPKRIHCLPSKRKGLNGLKPKHGCSSTFQILSRENKSDSELFDTRLGNELAAELPNFVHRRHISDWNNRKTRDIGPFFRTNLKISNFGLLSEGTISFTSELEAAQARIPIFYTLLPDWNNQKSTDRPFAFGTISFT